VSQATPFVTRPPAPQHRPNITILVVPCLFVIVTFLFWYQTWFGRQLSPQEMQQSLTDTSVPHKTQHALSQMADRMSRGDAKVRRWYPQVLALSRSEEPLFRLTTAWVMGQDNSSEEFHRALVGLLRDPDARVQWNAALALVRFGDASGEPQLRLMLSPSTLPAPQSGVVQLKLKPRDSFRAGTVVAHIRTAAGLLVEVRSPVDGEIKAWDVPDGATVSAGQSLARMSPSDDQVWEALRGLYLVGGERDLEAVEACAQGGEGISLRVKHQAEMTAQAIHHRLASQRAPS
jgi:hypothetical protein